MQNIEQAARKVGQIPHKMDMLSCNTLRNNEVDITRFIDPLLRHDPGFVYALQRHGLVKIGCTIDVKRRVWQFGASASLIKSWPVDDMRGAESALHDRYARRWQYGEWYMLDASEIDELRAVQDVQAFVDCTVEILADA